MTKSMKSMLFAAAVTGMITGATALQAESSSSTAQVAGSSATLTTVSMAKNSCNGKSGCNGQKSKTTKHSCKSKSGCNGKSSCNGKSAKS